MRPQLLLLCLSGGLLIAPAWAQSPPAAAAQVNTPAAATTGGLVHGTVKAGNIPLPGVSVVATNTLTGQRYATVTDINGNYSMTIPANGRYVLKTELAAFGPETKTVLIKSTPGPTAVPPANQQADFALTLASRVPPETAQENLPGAPALGQRPAAPGPAKSFRRSPKSCLAGATRRRRGHGNQQRGHRSSPAFPRQ